MRKYIAPVLAALLLAGCGKTAPVTEPTAEPTTEPLVQTTAPVTEPSTDPVTEPSTEAPTDATTEPPTEAPTSRFDPEVCGPLMGRWHLPLVLDGNLLMLTDFETSVTLDLIWQFDESETFTAVFDQETFEAALAEYESAMNVHMMERRYQMFAADCRREGLWEWATNQKWEKEGYREQNQAEVDAFILELDLGSRYRGLERGGKYYVRDGALMLEYADGTTDSVDYALEDQTLTLSGLDNESVYAELLIRPPLKLEFQEISAPEDPTVPTEEITEPTEETPESLPL